MVSISILFSITKLLSGHEEIFHVFSLLSDEVDFSISFIRWLRSFSCSLPRTILLKTHFAYVVSISILFATTKLLSRHEEIFHVFSLSSDEVEFSISFVWWLWSFSCSLPCLGMWSAIAENTRFVCLSGQYIYSVFHNKAAVRTWRNIPRFLSVIWVAFSEVDFSISFIRWLRSFSCSLPRTILLKTHFAYVVSISILFATTKLLSRHEEIFHVFSLSSDEVEFSISFVWWLWSFSCSLRRNLLLKTHFA